VLPVEAPSVAFPAYVAVIEFEPTLNPFAALAITLLSVAIPPETVAVPNVALPIAKVTVPVMVPGMVELTEAVSPIVPPSVAEVGEAVTVVVVAAGPGTVSVVLPIEAAKIPPPPKVAVIVFEPAINPVAGLTAALFSVASPPETAAVPKVVVPIEKVTVPVMVPAVVELTEAVNAVVPPSATKFGEAMTVVVVGTGSDTDMVEVPVEVAKVVLPPNVAVMVSVPALKPFAAVTTALLSVANPPETVAVPKTVAPIEKVTVPAMVPPVVELTEATNSVEPPSVAEAGTAVNVVVVTASTASVVLPFDAA
jgi:hypothetical protein